MPKAKGHFIAPRILQRSRDFRHPLTPPEAKIWRAVRNRQLGFMIRRQHPIGRFIADFYCAEAMLVIEIDGDVHADPDQAEYDQARTGWLEERGYPCYVSRRGKLRTTLRRFCGHRARHVRLGGAREAYALNEWRRAQPSFKVSINRRLRGG
jgi:very-short-patch-repair endonuclease